MLDDVVAEDVSAWRAGFDEVFARVAGVFYRAEPRRWARSYLTGLLAPVERKNTWQLSEAAGEVDPGRLQHFLNRSRWDADELRDCLRSYVAEALACPDGVLVPDETGFLKKGVKSAGVQRQYSGTAGRVENSQLGVFLAYAGSTGRALIDRELYLPESWIGDRDRCTEAGIPESRCSSGLLTKPRLAEMMIARTLDAGVAAGWVAADAAYGRDGRFRAFCESRRLSYVLEVPVRQTVADLDGRRRVDTLVARAPAQAWHRVSAGLGVRGEREYDWAWATLPHFGDLPAGYTRTLLARRSLDDPADIAYYLCFHPATIEREQVVAVAGARWAVEECFQAAKDQCGLDDYQVRKWYPWYRHITLAMLAHAFLAVTAATDPKAHAGWAESQSPISAVSWR
ncbi:IS701 family transposase [Nocardia sp. CA-107356]|uniref:IS701 family transposase n=1 Tax=Nocardia sp. CA-107356 TaxID=3239972 RepID=UPI003D90DEEE